MRPSLERVQRELLLTRLVNDIQLLLESRQSFKSLHEFVADWMEKHPRPENGTLKPFSNPFDTRYYGENVMRSWCDVVPEILDEEPQGWCRAIPNRNRLYYDFDIYGDIYHDPARLAYVPTLPNPPKLKEKAVKKYPESMMKLDPKQMERLLKELKDL